MRRREATRVRRRQTCRYATSLSVISLYLQTRYKYSIALYYSSCVNSPNKGHFLWEVIQ